MRWRCLTAGCNPVLDEQKAQAHKDESGHRVAKWPVRSAEGKRRAKARNRNGYYDKYNVGAKSPEARGLTSGRDYDDEYDHPFSSEALGQC
jgi:hypothetical protein